jgi:threonine dehydrogenase-like Zn-dependent dehydrogenase
MPKQLVAVAPRKAALVDYDEPEIGRHRIKVRVEYASPKHGSEVGVFRGEDPFVADLFDEDWRLFVARKDAARDTNDGGGPVLLGNQWVGIVAEKGGGVRRFSVGDRVCGYGGIRETQMLNADTEPFLLPVPDGMPWKSALCLDPAQFALGGIRDGRVRLGDRVAVFGLGAIGAIAAQMARVAGADYVAVIDPIQKRRDAAVAAGADAAFDPASEDVGLELKRTTSRAGVDVAIETSGNEQALQQALRGLGYGGTIAFVGWARAFSGTLDLGREAHFNNANLVFSRASSEPSRDHPRWNRQRIAATCWNLLSSNQIDCQRIIDPVVPFPQAPDAYQQYVDRNPQESIKLGIAFV